MLEFSSKFCVLLLPFIVFLQNKHTTLVENGENLISAQPRISAQGGQSNKYGFVHFNNEKGTEPR